MKKTFSTLALTLALIIPNSFAENLNEKDKKIYLHLGGFSKHFESRRSNGQEYNENHKNIGIEFEDRFETLDNYLEGSKWFSGNYHYGFVLQHMDNSIDYDSTIIGATVKRKWNLDWDENWKFGIGALFGAQNGYPKAGKRDENEFVPIVLPLAELSYKRFGVYATCVPEIHVSGFCFVGFKFKAFEF